MMVIAVNATALSRLAFVFTACALACVVTKLDGPEEACWLWDLITPYLGVIPPIGRAMR